MILIGLGSSLPFNGQEPATILRRAARSLDSVAAVFARSTLYSSRAWPDPDDPPFINAVVAARRGPPPEALLAALHAIEAAFGRRRSVRNAPRTLDLDLLAYDDLIIDAGGQNGLALPHPRLEDRDFVLAPLAEIAPHWRHPASGRTASEALRRLEPPHSARPMTGIL